VYSLDFDGWMLITNCYPTWDTLIIHFVI